MSILDLQADLWKDSGPNQWNDPDVLEVGNGGMTPAEYRAHFSLWAMLAAPLIAGNDLSSMSDDTLSILTNRDVIAVDQDILGQQARKIMDDGNYEVWERPLKGGDKTVVLLNRSGTAKSMSVNWGGIGLAGRHESDSQEPVVQAGDQSRKGAICDRSSFAWGGHDSVDPDALSSRSTDASG